MNAYGSTKISTMTMATTNPQVLISKIPTASSMFSSQCAGNRAKVQFPFCSSSKRHVAGPLPSFACTKASISSGPSSRSLIHCNAKSSSACSIPGSMSASFRTPCRERSVQPVHAQDIDFGECSFQHSWACNRAACYPQQRPSLQPQLFCIASKGCWQRSLRDCLLVPRPILTARNPEVLVQKLPAIQGDCAPRGAAKTRQSGHVQERLRQQQLQRRSHEARSESSVLERCSLFAACSGCFDPQPAVASHLVYPMRLSDFIRAQSFCEIHSCATCWV